MEIEGLQGEYFCLTWEDRQMVVPLSIPFCSRFEPEAGRWLSTLQSIADGQIPYAIALPRRGEGWGEGVDSQVKSAGSVMPAIRFYSSRNARPKLFSSGARI